MGLATCKFVHETQGATARNAQPLTNPISLLLLTLGFSCTPFGNDGFGSWIVNAFESLQNMKISLINRQC